MTALAIDLDVLGDVGPLWEAWLETRAPPRRRARAPSTSSCRTGASCSNASPRDRAPVYLRPNAQASAALRRLQGEGVRLGVFTDAPEELARIAVAQLGAARRIEALESEPGSLDRLLAKLGPDARVVRAIADLHS